MQNKRKCVSCEKYFDFANEGQYAEVGSDAGKPVCQNCIDQDQSDSDIAVLTQFFEGERQDYNLGYYSISGYTDELITASTHMLEHITWHGQGWRGAYMLDSIPEGWERVGDGWGSLDGLHDDDGGVLETIETKLEKEDTPSFPLIILNLRTSNCMSRGLEAYIPKDRRAEFTAWIGGK